MTAGDGDWCHSVVAFRRTGRAISSAAVDSAAADKSYSVVARNCVSCMADCRLMDCSKSATVPAAALSDSVWMDGRYSDCHTSADSDDVMRKLVAKAVRE